MKIFFLINELNVRGGTHKQLLRLCEYAESRDIDFEIITTRYAKGKGYPEFEKYTKKIFETPRFRLPINYFTNQLRIAKYIAKVNPQSVNIHDNGFDIVPILLKLLNYSGNIVWQINDLHPSFKLGNCREIDVRFSFLFKKVNIISASLVNSITVNVTKNKERVKDYLGQDATVLFCGIDDNVIAKKVAVRDISADYINLLSIGVFFPYRNYETQIETVALLKKRGYNVHLDIVGSIDLDRDYYNQISKLISDRSLNQEIKIHGEVSESILRNLFDKAHLFLFLNIDQSWGLAVFEAMASSMPVIVSNSVGAIELLSNGKDSIVVDPKDTHEIAIKIEGLINNSTRYNEISENAKKLTDTMTWNEMYCKKALKIISHEK